MSADCKITIVPIRLYYRPNDDLNLVICYGLAKTSMMLITNLESDDKRLGVAVKKWKLSPFQNVYTAHRNLPKFHSCMIPASLGAEKMRKLKS